MMFLIFNIYFSNYDPMHMLFMFSLFMMIILSFLVLISDMSWLPMILILFMVGGIMVFICMVSSTYKGMKSSMRFNNMMNIFMFFLLMFFMFNMEEEDESFPINFMLDNNLILIFSLNIIILILSINVILIMDKSNMKL